MSWRAAAPTIARSRVELLSNRLRTAANDPRVLPARLALPERNATTRLTAVLWPIQRRSQQLALAAQLVELATHADGDVAARASGVGNLAGGNLERARASFEAIRRRTAADWNDLAAVQICIALRNGDPDRWLSALAAADRAIEANPSLVEARFNRAAIIEAMGVTPVARAQWMRYRRLDSGSPWSHAAQQRLARFTASEMDTWNIATANLDSLSVNELAQLAERCPQTARRYAEALYLPSWAMSLGGGDARSAQQHLDRVRVIARVLHARGEPLLFDSVAAIDRAANDPAIIQSLVDGLTAYLRGRQALRNGVAGEAERELRASAALFARSGNPMTGVAEFWVACALSEQNRIEDARALLLSLLTRETVAGRYKALIGHAQYQLSLLDSVRGNWTASLAAAQEAKAAFAQLGERGNFANASAMLSEAYDLLGQPELAWKHGFAAVRDSAADGTLDRTRVALAALCRTELRGGRWERAQSLARLEGELAPVATDVRLDPDMFVRRAVADWHQSRDATAARWLRLARDAANRIPDPAVRTKLLADVAAAEGMFTIRRDARAAIRFLSTAILFQKQSARPVLLPELYLERGRAFLLANDLRSAESDFDAGLAELERQRSNVHDAELRPGIFDDASELFDEMIALQIRRGASVDAVLQAVERGRARSVFEQISASDDFMATPHLPAIREIQRALTPGSALIEYYSLPDRLVALAITRERAVMRTAPVTRDALGNAARAFPLSEDAGGSALHDLLIAPIQSELRGILEITIAGDDLLQRVPFAALFDRTTQTFLVQRHVVATTPSAAVWLATLARCRDQKLPSQPTVLVFANPTIPRAEFGDLISLSAAESEARKVAGSYVHANVFIRDMATAARFVELAPSSEYVHFGGHAVINEREPSASALVCAASSDHVGAITSREIARMNFRSTRAVVLAACSTMRGRNAAIEGVPSLSRAFIVGGVPAVIGTLWDIQDTDAVAITRPLHELLGRGVPPAQALRLAQLDAIRRRLPVSQWAAFAMMGSASCGSKTAAAPDPPSPAS